MSEHNIEIDKDDAIVSLVLQNRSLEGRVKAHEETIMILQQEKIVVRQERDKLGQSSVFFEDIAKFVKGSLQNGTIPLPEFISKLGLPVVIKCEPSMVVFNGRDGFSVLVEIFCAGNHHGFNFSMGIIPEGREIVKDVYPDFHYGFTKPVRIRKKANKKPVVKKTTE